MSYYIGANHSVAVIDEYVIIDEITMPAERWNRLFLYENEIDEALMKLDTLQRQIGGGFFFTVKNNTIDLREFVYEDGETIQTQYGVILTQSEWYCLKLVARLIKHEFPIVSEIGLCIDRSDHQNQLGWLQCRECNPFPDESGFFYW
jgi:hypothetical protein